MFRLLWLYSALYDLTGIGARGPKYPFPEPWRLGLGQIALASPFAVVGGGSETTGAHFGACMTQPLHFALSLSHWLSLICLEPFSAALSNGRFAYHRLSAGTSDNFKDKKGSLTRFF